MLMRADHLRLVVQLFAALVEGPCTSDLLALVDDSIAVRPPQLSPLTFGKTFSRADHGAEPALAPSLSRLAASGLVSGLAFGCWHALAQSAGSLGAPDLSGAADLSGLPELWNWPGRLITSIGLGQVRQLLIALAADASRTTPSAVSSPTACLTSRPLSCAQNPAPGSI